MTEDKPAIKYLEGQKVLFESSFKAIPFNIVMASILAGSLYYNDLPLRTTVIWLSAIFIISIGRMLYCRFVLSKGEGEYATPLNLNIFLFLTLIMGLTWSTIYFASLHAVEKPELYLILLVCGGMAAGSTASMGVYMPAFYTYVLSIFCPIILYNYSLLDVNAAFFATMFVFFLIAITIIAKSHQKLFANIFFLTEQNKALKEKFEQLSITDSLTGLYNRRYFLKTIHDEYNRARRNKHSLSIISLDVDNFKLINDNLGHPFGDEFLKYLSFYLKHHLKRANDIIFRIGGDEFIAILINTSEESTKEICNKIKECFLKSPIFNYNPQDSIRESVLAEVTLSMGVLYVPFDATADIDSIIAMVDQLLYQSKHQGKNVISYRSCR